MGKNINYKKLFGIFLILVTCVTPFHVYAIPIEIAASTGFALGIGGGGINLGAGLNVMLALPELVTRSKTFASGIGLMIHADVFFKSLVHIDRAENNIATVSQKGSNKSTSKAINNKISKEDAMIFLNKYRVNFRNIDMYRIVIPRLSIRSAIISYNTIKIYNTKFNFFFGPHFGFAAFQSQDALGYIYDKTFSVRGISEATVKQEGAHAIMDVTDYIAPEINNFQKGAKLDIYFSKPGSGNPYMPAASYYLPASTGNPRDGSRLLITFARSRFIGDILDPTERDIKHKKKQVAAYKYALERIDSKKINQAILKAIEPGRSGFDPSKFKKLYKDDAGQAIYNVQALLAGFNAGCSIYFVKTFGMSIGLEASYHIDIPVKSFGRIELTQKVANALAENFIYDKLADYVDGIEVTSIKLAYNQFAIAKRYKAAKRSRYSTFVVNILDVGGQAKKPLNTMPDDYAEKMQYARLSYNDHDIIPDDAFFGAYPKHFTSGREVKKSSGRLTTNNVEYIGGLMYHVKDKIKLADDADARQEISVTFVKKDAFDINFAGNKSPKLLYSSKNLKDKLIPHINDTRVPYLPIVHKINISIKIGMHF